MLIHLFKATNISAVTSSVDSRCNPDEDGWVHYMLFSSKILGDKGKSSWDDKNPKR